MEEHTSPEPVVDREWTREKLVVQIQKLHEKNQALEAKASRYKTFFDNSPAGFCLLDSDNLVRDFNSTAKKLLTGRFPLEFQRPFFLYISAEHHLKFHQKTRLHPNSSAEMFEALTISQKWLQFLVTNLPGEGRLLTFWDLSDLYSKKAEVEEAQFLLETALERLPFSLKMVTSEMKVWREAGLPLEKWLQIVPADYRKLLASLSAVLTKNSTYEAVPCRALDGRLLMAHLVHLQKNEPQAAITLVDLTEQEKARQELLNVQRRQSFQARLKAISLLSGRLAHHLNTSLTTIQGHLAELQEESIPSHLKKRLNDAMNVSRLASQVAGELLGFVQNQPGQSPNTDLTMLLPLVAELVNKIFPEPITVDVSLPGAPIRVGVNGNILQASLQELFLESILESGQDKLDLTVQLTPEPEKALLAISGWIHSVPPNLISISALENLRREDVDIQIRQDSLEIRLAYSDEKISGSAQNNTPVEATKSCILLVEDDHSLRNLLGRILKKQGYQVLLAGDGAAGLSTYYAQGGNIDLLVTDIVMPIIDGIELAEKLRAVNHEIPLIFVSGYKPDDNRPLPTPSNFLRKPFSPEELSKMVEKTLSGRSAAVDS